MAGKVVVSLVGEQTIPNIVPLVHLQQEGEVDKTLLVYTKLSTGAYERTSAILTEANITCSGLRLEHDYDLEKIRTAIKAAIKDQGWTNADTLFNFTGGNKIMMLAACSIALEQGCELIYYQSHAGDSLIYRLEVSAGNIAAQTRCEEIGGVLTISTYFRAYGRRVDNYTTRQQMVAKVEKQNKVVEEKRTKLAAASSADKKKLRNELEYAKGDWRGPAFELAVYDALAEVVDEIYAGVDIDAGDIDVVVRIRNVVGIIEVKSGEASTGRKPFDQLVMSGGSVFGAYNVRMFVTDKMPDANFPSPQFSDHIKSHKIEICHLGSFFRDGKLNDDDICSLRQFVHKCLYSNYTC